jgi:hypothetical protein
MLPRNKAAWEICLQPLDLNFQSSSLLDMNRNLLTSYHNDRAPSPLSDIEDDNMQVDESGFDNFTTQVAAPSTLSTSAFHYPDSSDTNYMVLQTNFNKDNRKNKRIPYPISASERQEWTTQQRQFASLAVALSNSLDFASEVSMTIMNA